MEDQRRLIWSLDGNGVRVGCVYWKRGVWYIIIDMSIYILVLLIVTSVQ